MLEGEEKLINSAKQGKTEGFDRLYNHYLPPIYRFIYMKVSHREEAEDLAHEVFLSAWQNIHNYKHRGFPFSSWLYQIARNRVIDYYRVKKTNIPLEKINPVSEFLKFNSLIEETLDQELNIEEVKAAMRKLNNDQQDVLLMRFMENLTHEEIAKAIGKSEGAVRLIQHRGIKALKKIFFS